MESTITNSFTITPMGQSFHLEAGKTYDGSVTVANGQYSSGDLSYTVSIVPYGVTGEQYDVDIFTEANQTQLSKWIKFKEPSGTISPGQKTTVDFTITVPADAPGGGQYAAIVIDTEGLEKVKSNSIDIAQSYGLVSVIYADVAGETVHEGSIVKHEIPTITTQPNTESLIVFSNSGNVHEYAKVNLTITDTFSGKVIFSNKGDESLPSEVIMPGTTRALFRQIEGLPGIGIVNVEESVNYMGESSVVSHQIFIIPFWFMAIVVFVLAGIGTLITMKVRKRKQKKVDAQI